MDERFMAMEHAVKDLQAKSTRHELTLYGTDESPGLQGRVRAIEAATLSKKEGSQLFWGTVFATIAAVGTIVSILISLVK